MTTTHPLTDRRARPRTSAHTCDALGVCQAHATPCKGCDNTHPAYHHLHRVHQPAPTHRACAANACRQGHKACPTPQACEVADEPPATRTELTSFVLWGACVALAIVGALVLSAGA